MLYLPGPVHPSEPAASRLPFVTPRLEDEERWRQELEDTEVNIKLEDVRRLIMEYMVR